MRKLLVGAVTTALIAFPAIPASAEPIEVGECRDEGVVVEVPNVIFVCHDVRDNDDCTEDDYTITVGNWEYCHLTD